jgi:hypothetical protein
VDGILVSAMREMVKCPRFHRQSQTTRVPSVFDKALDLIRDRIEILQWDMEVNGIVKPVYYLEGRVYWVDVGVKEVTQRGCAMDVYKGLSPSRSLAMKILSPNSRYK